MKFSADTIDFSDTHSFDKLFIDYITNSTSLDDFYSYKNTINEYAKAINDIKGYPFNREVLTSVITQQYKNCGISNGRINELLNTNTFTICTGHQLSIFAGPLYFIYKILTTIKLTEELKTKHPAYNFVPIFWMASEDHDFEEISSVTIFNKSFTWKKFAENSPTGLLNTDSLSELLNELKPILNKEEKNSYIYDLLQQCYGTTKTLADATRLFLHELFQKQGLVIIDANDAILKSNIKDILKNDLFTFKIFEAVNFSSKKLAEKGYKTQVNAREINLFYIYNKQRNRIVLEENATYKVLNTNINFTKKDLEEEIDNYPERFSPNVVLRPLYQQLILPNIAYVGGPAEISYWLQLKKMFTDNNVFYPVLVPRNSALIIDKNTQVELEKIGLKNINVFSSSEDWINQFLNTNNLTSSLLLDEERKKTSKLYEDLSKKVEAIDITLKNTVEAEHKKQLSSIDAIEKKLIRAQKQKHDVSINKIKKIKEKLFPNNSLQERELNFISFCHNSEADFLEALKNNFNPFINKFYLLKEL